MASRVISEAAMKEGIDVVMSEIHGMSQRGGVVESVVVLGGLKGPLIKKGDADLLIAFEPNEALRAAPYCSQKTTAIINSSCQLITASNQSPATVSSGRQETTGSTRGLICMLN